VSPGARAIVVVIVVVVVVAVVVVVVTTAVVGRRGLSISSFLFPRVS